MPTYSEKSYSQRLTSTRFHVTFILMNDTTVILQPKLTATNRTKDRIRQHGTPRGKDFKDGRGCPMAFTLMREDRVDGVFSWMLKSQDGWLGWIPSDEIDCLNYSWRSLYKGK